MEKEELKESCSGVWAYSKCTTGTSNWYENARIINASNSLQI